MRVKSTISALALAALVACTSGETNQLPGPRVTDAQSDLREHVAGLTSFQPAEGAFAGAVFGAAICGLASCDSGDLASAVFTGAAIGNSPRGSYLTRPLTKKSLQDGRRKEDLRWASVLTKRLIETEELSGKVISELPERVRNLNSDIRADVYPQSYLTRRYRSLTIDLSVLARATKVGDKSVERLKQLETVYSANGIDPTALRAQRSLQASSVKRLSVLRRKHEALLRRVDPSVREAVSVARPRR